ERRRDPVMVQELAGYAAVLAGDQVGGGEDLERPHRDVAQIADRGRDQVESRGKGWCNGRPAVDEVLPRPLTAGAGGGCGRRHGRHSTRVVPGRHEWSATRTGGAAPARRASSAKTACFGNRYPFHLVNHYLKKCPIADAHKRQSIGVAEETGPHV